MELRTSSGAPPLRNSTPCSRKTGSAAGAISTARAAERIATEIFDAIHANVAAKADLQLLKSELETRIAQLEHRLISLGIRAPIVAVGIVKALGGVHGCFHLAAVSSVELSNRDWLGAHRTNLTGAITLFDAARAAGPITVVYASSAAVYGDCASLPLHETSETRPLSPYGADKLGCELHARAGSRIHCLPSVGLRLFNVYGPGQDPKSPYSGVISFFCERLRRGEAIEVFGDGSQTRDFVFVADVVGAMLRAMDGGLQSACVFNICTGRGTSVLELARTIASLCGKDPEIRFGPERKGEVRHSYGDPTAARQALGVGPYIDLRIGLSQTLAWLKRASDVPIAVKGIG